MIISENKQDVSVSGNFKTSGFKIQASSKAFDILSSNIYTHKVKAVIREISCNAVDSHTAAGNPDPIKVHLPTKLEPHFAVRDFGTGLSDEDVREIFTTYFCSTKTSSNDFVGALGLGSKSPFCLVDSFTVTSFFNSAKNLYSCYRDENGEPQVALLTSEDTSEPNGVEVSMSIEDKHIEEFAMEAEHVYFYFNQMPNINKQSVVDAINTRKSKIVINTDDVCVERWHGWNGLNAVMGGVCYEIPSSISTLNISGYIKFEMGEISFDAGRESLSLDDKTVNAIKNKSEKIKEELSKKAIEVIRNKQTPFQRALMAQTMSNAPGVKASDLYEFDLPKTTEPMQYYSRTGWRHSVDSGQTVNLPVGEKYRYFKYQPRFTGRIKQEVKSVGGTIVLLTDQQIAETKIDADVIENLNDLPPVERTTNSGRSYQKQASVLVWNGRDHYKDSENWDEEDNLPVSEKVYVYVHRNKVDGCSNNLVSLAHSLGIKIYGVKAAYAKTTAFKNGNWISLKDYMTRTYKDTVDNTVFKKSLDYKWDDTCEYLRKANKNHVINCDVVKDFLNAWNPNEDHQTLRTVAARMYWEIKEDDTLDKMMEQVIMKHPMIEFVSLSWNDDKDSAYKTIADYLNRKAC